MRTQYNGPSRPAPPRRAGDASHRPIAAGLQLGTAHADAIVQSHERCVALGVSRIERPDFTPLGRADLGVAFERNRRLHEQAAPVMEMLYEQIINSQSLVALTDATGTVLHSIGDDEFMGRANKVALKPGVNWSESTKGTNAVGTALVEEAPTLVHADEHYLHANHFLTCSAAPILDPRGNMLGVLDVSGDHRSYHAHTMALVKMSARMIENRWLTDCCHHDGRNVMRLHFHSRPEFIGTLMEGILALGADGKIIGANRSALEQVGISNAALRQHTLHTLLGSTVGAMVDRFRSPLCAPMPLRLADGRVLHVLARFNWPVWTKPADSRDGPATAPAPAAQSAPLNLPEPAELNALRTGCATMDAVIEKLSRAVDSGMPTLLMGDTGTGKEVLARALHADSSRRGQPFVAVHCAGLPPDLIEAELFGSPAAPGKALLAQAGTLFIDEVGALPLPVQARLLRLLQDGGAMEARLVCATRDRLRVNIAAGSFREDLFYRLNGVAVRVPTLRERSDIAVLWRRLLDAEPGGRALRLAPEVSALFLGYPWPGNVRQLHNVLRSACVMAAGESVITRAHLSDDFLEDAAAHAPVAGAEAAPPRQAAPNTAQSLEDLELAAIRRAVEDAGGNISVASRALGVSRNTIYRKLRWKQPA